MHDIYSQIVKIWQMCFVDYMKAWQFMKRNRNDIMKIFNL